MVTSGLVCSIPMLTIYRYMSISTWIEQATRMGRSTLAPVLRVSLTAPINKSFAIR